MKTRAQIDAAKKPVKKRRPVVWSCRVREVRMELGLTIGDVSKATGLSNAAICNAEHGSGCDLDTRQRIAGYFGMEVTELWEIPNKSMEKEDA